MIKTTTSRFSLLLDEQKSPESLLDSLRWKADTVVTTHDGERVWLKECFGQDGKRIGITDCCPVNTPCGWHRGLASAMAVWSAR